MISAKYCSCLPLCKRVRAKSRNVPTNMKRGIALCCLELNFDISKGFDVKRPKEIMTSWLIVS
jgi:hypothetical protein